MWLIADGGEDERRRPVALRRDNPRLRHAIPEAARPAYSRPSRRRRAGRTGPSGEAGAGRIDIDGQRAGHRPGPAIARHLTALMGGQLRCEGWSTIDGRTGNDFILTLPMNLLPGQRGRAPGQAPAEGRPLPRTRVLLAGDPTGLRRRR